MSLDEIKAVLFSQVFNSAGGGTCYSLSVLERGFLPQTCGIRNLFSVFSSHVKKWYVKTFFSWKGHQHSCSKLQVEKKTLKGKFLILLFEAGSSTAQVCWLYSRFSALSKVLFINQRNDFSRVKIILVPFWKTMKLIANLDLVRQGSIKIISHW